MSYSVEFNPTHMYSVTTFYPHPPQWTRLQDGLPGPGIEVLVWVDGHRGPAWSNHYALVAYVDVGGRWWEERHSLPLDGVEAWMPLPEGPE